MISVDIERLTVHADIITDVNGDVLLTWEDEHGFQHHEQHPNVATALIRVALLNYTTMNDRYCVESAPDQFVGIAMRFLNKQTRARTAPIGWWSRYGFIQTGRVLSKLKFF
jgi:hypothetical protein